MSLPVVRPILSQDVFNELQTEALKDNHKLLYPTHAVLKDGLVSGYVGMCKTPLITYWGHTQRLSARDSLAVFHSIDALAANAGMSQFVTMCSPDSPYREYMGKLGFTSIGTTELFVKEL